MNSTTVAQELLNNTLSSRFGVSTSPQQQTEWQIQANQDGMAALMLDVTQSQAFQQASHDVGARHQVGMVGS